MIAVPTVAATPDAMTAPVKRGWGRLILALLAFLLLPLLPWFRALLPIEQTAVLVIPALAACAVVGWWAGGRLSLAIIWLAAAMYVTLTRGEEAGSFVNLARGWALLVAGAFGLVSLFGDRRPFFSRALASVVIAFGLSLAMSLVRPSIGQQATRVVADELAKRNGQTMDALHQAIRTHADRWREMTEKNEAIAAAPGLWESTLDKLSRTGVTIFPALLALQSLAALALAWAVYHRVARIRLGPPLGQLRDFRFNDQLVWGLIVGLVLYLLPTLEGWHGAGKNLVVFFGVLYGIRGLGVLSWFLAPGVLTRLVLLGFLLLWLPLLGEGAALALLSLGVAAVGIGLGDTWADWRVRAAMRRANPR